MTPVPADVPTDPPVEQAESLRLRALERLDDVATAERALLLHAVHPRGLAASAAWLLGFDAASQTFDRMLDLLGDQAPAEYAACFDEARRIRPRQPHASFRLGAAQLDAEARRAWDDSLEPAAQAPLPWDGHAVRAIALHHGARPIGLLVAAFEGDAASPDALAACRAWFAAACDRVAAVSEARSQRQRGQALAELARAAVSFAHLAEADPLVVRHAAHSLDARGAALWRSAANGALQLVATAGPCARREATARGLSAAAVAAATRGRWSIVSEPGADGETHVVAIAPLVAFGAVHGVLAVWDPAPAPGGVVAFAPHDAEFVAAVADVAAALCDQAARHDAQRRGERERSELRTRLRREEQLAAAGEAATRLAREARQPLASVAAFARRVHRTLAESDPNRECLEIVMRETERLERHLLTPGDWAVLEPPRLSVQSLNAIAQEVLAHAGEALVRRRVRLSKTLDPDLPGLLLDPERIRRVVRNLVDAAVDEVSPGGRVRVESRRVREWAVLEVAHDGVQSPGDLLDELFRSLSGSGDGDAGLGVAQRVVREHGGELRVRREREWSVIVTLTLPIGDNQDRRRPGADRRSARRDRRARSLEASHPARD